MGTYDRDRERERNREIEIWLGKAENLGTFSPLEG